MTLGKTRLQVRAAVYSAPVVILSRLVGGERKFSSWLYSQCPGGNQKQKLQFKPGIKSAMDGGSCPCRDALIYKRVAGKQSATGACRASGVPTNSSALVDGECQIELARIGPSRLQAITRATPCWQLTPLFLPRQGPNTRATDPTFIHVGRWWRCRAYQQGDWWSCQRQKIHSLQGECSISTGSTTPVKHRPSNTPQCLQHFKRHANRLPRSGMARSRPSTSSPEILRGFTRPA
jgi:hypothetical protein